MTATAVIHKYVPREVLKAFHARSQRWALIVAHRRFGKTVGVLNDMVVKALRTSKHNAFYAYIAPYYGQAKQASWIYLKDATRNIPGIKVSESELTITLPNGARIRVFGADNPDALRGLYFDGVVLDEFGDMNGRVWTEVIRPALADRQGWAVFIGTPRGKNKFYEMREKARQSKEWFYLEVKASQSGVLPDAELEANRQDMDEDEYEQEFECSFDATIRGSYYGKHITALAAIVPPRITEVEDTFDEPVSLAMDIGRRDATAIWFWQVVNGEIRFIDYWEDTGWDAEEIVDMLQMKPYTYETWWLPHDADHETFASKKSVIDIFRSYGAPAKKVPNPDKGTGLLHGVNAVRNVLRKWPIFFDETRTARGLEALKNYSRKWDADKKVFGSKPEHDQWSHGADAFRYACLSIKPTDIGRSVEKMKERKRAPNPFAQGDLAITVNKARVVSDIFAAHFKKMNAQRGTGRERI